MVKKTIKLNSIDNIRKFVTASNRQPFEIDILSGRFAIDGKSIMGIFSLDISKNILMQIHADTEAECSAFLEELGNIVQ